MPKVTSADGTTIAYDRYGSGAPVIVIGGALCDRTTLQPLAEELAKDFTVVSYDRRGRGDSGDTTPYSVAREVEDLGALITALGGIAAVYGHSSGAGLLAVAAASGLPITKVVCTSPRTGRTTSNPSGSRTRWARPLTGLLALNRRAEAVEQFLAMAGMPADAVAEMSSDPGIIAAAHTIAYDFAVMDAAPGGTVPFELLAKVDAAGAGDLWGGQPALHDRQRPRRGQGIAERAAGRVGRPAARRTAGGTRSCPGGVLQSAMISIESTRSG